MDWHLPLYTAGVAAAGLVTGFLAGLLVGEHKARSSYREFLDRFEPKLPPPVVDYRTIEETRRAKRVMREGW